MARRPRSLKPMDQINLTSLLDLTFVLLIAFMIIAPTLRPEIKVNLPEEVDGTTGGQPDDNTVVVTIDKRPKGTSLDRIYVTVKGKRSERIKDMDELILLLRSAKLREPKTNVTIELDKEVPSQTFVKVIGACREAGIDEVAIPTDEADLVGN